MRGMAEEEEDQSPLQTRGGVHRSLISWSLRIDDTFNFLPFVLALFRALFPPLR
jgi:hypothetical protein